MCASAQESYKCFAKRLKLNQCTRARRDWGTPGGRRTVAPTNENAHPHVSEDGKLSLIHNGIVENFAALREEIADAEVKSETDTEVVAVLLGREVQQTGDLERAFRNVVKRLEGTFTLLAAHRDEPGKW